MPKQSQLSAGSRGRPVSCRFCRSRKLRCSRNAPCSNCVSRGLPCDLELPDPSSLPVDDSSKAKLLERIRLLEEQVKSGSQFSTKTIFQPSPRSESGEIQQPSPVSELDRSHPNEILDRDAAWLESIYEGNNRLPDEIPRHHARFRICSIQHLLEAPQISDWDEPSPRMKSHLADFIGIPKYSEAKILLEKFVDHIEQLHRVVHVPSLPALLDRVYSCVSQNDCIKSGDALLLLGIFASAARSWSQADCDERGLFSIPTQAHALSKRWLKDSEDLLDVARRYTHVSLEGVQAVIIILFVPEKLEGFSRRCRLMNSTGLLLARELGLHCIDLPSNRHLAGTAQAEIGRRVWWHLVSTDWTAAARFNKVLHGVYQCQVRQMITNKPLNVNDEAVVDGMPRIGKPMSEPTEMSYTLYRIRMCEISRNFVDRTSMSQAATSGPSLELDIVMDIDNEMQLLLNDLPTFFSMQANEIQTRYKVRQSFAAKLAFQGRLFHQLFHAKRCKLHLPFLIRGFTDPEYAPSRDKCIQSARLIIQTSIDLDETGICQTDLKSLSLVTSVFMGSIILLMDVCQRKPLTCQSRQLGEVYKAFRMLECARHESQLTAEFLDSMKYVLNKHKARQRQGIEQPANNSTMNTPLSNSTMTGISVGSGMYTNVNSMPMFAVPTSVLESNEPGNIAIPSCDPVSLEDQTYFNELAQTFDLGIDVGSIDWNDVFQDLESSFLY